LFSGLGVNVVSRHDLFHLFDRLYFSSLFYFILFCHDNLSALWLLGLLGLVEFVGLLGFVVLGFGFHNPLKLAKPKTNIAI